MVALAGTGLLATTGLFGLGVLGASASDAAVGVECTTATPFAQDGSGDVCFDAVSGTADAGFGNTAVDQTTGDNLAVAIDANAYAGSRNTGGDIQTETGNKAFATSGGMAVAGSFGTGAKSESNNNTTIASTGGIAAAGSYGIGSKTTTNNDTAIASTGGKAFAGTYAGFETTANNDTAIASSNGSAYAGDHDTDGTTANNDSATASGGGTAYAGSDNTDGTTANNDKAVAIGSGSTAPARAASWMAGRTTTTTPSRLVRPGNCHEHGQREWSLRGDDRRGIQTRSRRPRERR